MVQAFILERRGSDASSYGFIELVADHTADRTSVAQLVVASEAMAFGKVVWFQPLGTVLKMTKQPILCVIQIHAV